MKVIAGFVLVLVAMQFGLEDAKHLIRTDITAQRQEEARMMLEVTDFIDDAVKKIIDGYRTKIPDPFQIALYQVRVIQEVLNCSLKLTNVEVDGARGYQVDNVNTSLVQQHLSLSVSLPTIKMKGHYDLHGLVEEMIPLYGSGDFYVEIDGFVVNASSNFILDGLSLKGIQNLKLDFDLQTLKVSFNGLMGNLSHVINQVINKDGAIILKKEWAAHRTELTSRLETLINSMLAPQLMQLQQPKYLQGLALYTTYTEEVTGNADEFVDQLMMNARKYITDKQLDPYPLPDEVKSFSKKILFITWHGHASLTHGTVAGHSTIHRVGDASLTTDGDLLTVDAGVGVNFIQAGYHCEATFMGIGPKFDLSANAPHPDIKIQVQANMTTLKMELTDFHIEDVGKITLKFTGLGILDWLANVLGGWVVNLFKGPIISRVESVARTEIQNALNNIEPPTALFSSVQRYYRM